MTVTGRRPADRMDWVACTWEVSQAVDEFFDSWKGPFGIYGEFRELGDRQTYFKAEPLVGRARVRHALRRVLLRRPYPRLAEFENLSWLAKQQFAVAKPLAAGVRKVWNGIDWQFLFTERFTNAQPLVLPGSTPDEERITELAREVARMHDLGFVHRDLHLRNLAWRVSQPSAGANQEPRILFYDAWRGGARWQSRGAAYDLLCLSKGLASEWGESSVDRFLGTYMSSRRRRSGMRRLERAVQSGRRQLA